MRTFASPPRLVFAAATACLAAAAHGQSISPGTVNATLGIGESMTIHKTITLGATGATNVDVFFLADNTGSMGGTITAAQAGASAIVGALPSTYQYGVGRYFGDPSEGVAPATAYQTLQPLTTNSALVQTGINGWIASGGGDTPEGNFFALQQVANTTAWRPDAQRLIVWFGDAESHTETTTKAQAISALQGANAKVIAFNNGSAGAGIDGRYTGEPVGTKQASDIIAAVGGSLQNNFVGASNAAFIAAVTAQITAAASFVDLAFGSSFGGGGLELTFTCTDLLGCTHVGGGESRTFDLTIKGLTAGIYDFSVFAQGIAATELDHIVVGDGVAAVPEPETYALMLAGLAAVGAIARRRRSGRGDRV
jgi:PEP-CTERM motif-containing protein/integrin beta-like protein